MILIIYISIYLYSKLRLEKIFAQNIKSTYMILLLYLYIKEFFGKDFYILLKSFN